MGIKRASKEKQKSSPNPNKEREIGKKLGGFKPMLAMGLKEHRIMSGKMYQTQDTHVYKRSSPSTHNSPLINRTMTPNLKSVQSKIVHNHPLYSPTLNARVKSSANWNGADYNSFQSRMNKYGLVEKPVKCATTETKRNRQSLKEGSVTMKRSADRNFSKERTITCFDACSEAKPLIRLESRESKANKENQHPNQPSPQAKKTKRALLKPSAGKDLSENLETFQMFGKFLNSMELKEKTTKSEKVKTISAANLSKLKRYANPKGKEEPEATSQCSYRINLRRESLKLLMKVARIMVDCYVSVQNNEEIYDLVKDYVDLSQHSEYRLINSLLNLEQRNFQDDFNQILLAMKLERWVIMIMFQFIFANPMNQLRAKDFIRELSKRAMQNNYTMLSVFFPDETDFEGLEDIKQAIFKPVMQKQAASVHFSSETSVLKSNNLVLMKLLLERYTKYFNTSSQICSIEICAKMMKALGQLEKNSISIATEKCYEVFYSFVSVLITQLADKKVISVETCVEENESLNEVLTLMTCQETIEKPTQKGLLKAKQSDGHALPPKPFCRRIKTNPSLQEDLPPNNSCQEYEPTKPKMDSSRGISGVFGSQQKKEFLELIRRLESEDPQHHNQLFLFQPVLDEMRVPTGPYLPDIKLKSKHACTLVLDLDETLVHFQENPDKSGGQFFIRPYAVEFLKEMAECYEVVIFTAALKEVRRTLTLSTLTGSSTR